MDYHSPYWVVCLIVMHTSWIHLYECGSEATSYENLDIFSRTLMNIQVGCMADSHQPVLNSSILRMMCG